MKDVIKTIGLLKSMVLCGETMSEESTKMVNESLQELHYNDWKRLEDEKPEPNSMYIVFAKTLDKDKPIILLSWYGKDGKWTLIPSIIADSITHWMPLPMSPQS